MLVFHRSAGTELRIERAQFLRDILKRPRRSFSCLYALKSERRRAESLVFFGDLNSLSLSLSLLHICGRKRTPSRDLLSASRISLRFRSWAPKRRLSSRTKCSPTKSDDDDDALNATTRRSYLRRKREDKKNHTHTHTHAHTHARLQRDVRDTARKLGWSEIIKKSASSHSFHLGQEGNERR